MPSRTNGRELARAIEAWADKHKLSIEGACEKIGIPDQNFYNWRTGTNASWQLTQRVIATIGPTGTIGYNIPDGYILIDMPTMKEVVSMLTEFSKLLDHKDSHVDMVVAATRLADGAVALNKKVKKAVNG